MEVKKNVPKIRFPQFTEDWEQRKLSEISDVRDGTHDSPSYLSEGHPFVTSKNVKDGYINYDDIQYISDEDFEAINKRSKVDINDILMGMIGTIGNLALIRTEPDFAIKNVALIKDTKQVSYMYLYHYLQSPSTERQLLSGLDGGTQKFVSLKNIRELNIMVPSAEEQIKVGAVIESLDNLITLHQRKCDKLKEYKKGCLQKMFSKEGSDVPEIRFPSFTDAWEQRKLDDILTERHILNKISDEYPRLSFTIEEGVIDPEDRKTNKRDFLMKDEANKKFLLTEVGDIIYNPANVVFGAIHRNSYGKGCLSPIYRIFETNQESRFLECVVRSETFISKLAQKTEGSVIKLKTLKPEAFLEMTVSISSSLDEQTKIADFFYNLDNLITLHQRKCDKYKELKKGLLQQMFV